MYVLNILMHYVWHCICVPKCKRLSMFESEGENIGDNYTFQVNPIIVKKKQDLET